MLEQKATVNSPQLDESGSMSWHRQPFVPCSRAILIQLQLIMSHMNKDLASPAMHRPTLTLNILPVVFHDVADALDKAKIGKLAPLTNYQDLLSTVSGCTILHNIDDF